MNQKKQRNILKIMFILLFGWVHKCHHCKIFNFFNFSLDTENFCYVQHIVLQSFLLKVFCILNFNSTDKLNTPWKLWILREFCHKVFANSSINKSWIDALVTIGFSYLISEWVLGFFRIEILTYVWMWMILRLLFMLTISHL